MDELVFGWRSTVMLIMICQMIIISVLVLVRSVEPLADRILIGLVLVVAGVLSEQMIGFAGFYDAFPWLTFTPLANPLFFGPLIAGYVYALTVQKPDRRWLWLLAPGALYFAYELFWVLQPMSNRMGWREAVHWPYVRPVRTVLEVIGAVAGLVVAFGLLARYRRWLSRSSSMRADYDLQGLGVILIAACVAALAPASVGIWTVLVGPLDFFQAFPSHIVLGISIQILGVAALLQPRTPFPKIEGEARDKPVREDEALAPDWPQIGAELASDIKKAGWYLEPRFTLAEAAERLHLPERTLSTAFNAGLGESFNALINRLRIEDVTARLLESQDDLLSIAFACGFNSKASFNRVFRERVGETPTQYRRRHQARPE